MAEAANTSNIMTSDFFILLAPRSGELVVLACTRINRTLADKPASPVCARHKGKALRVPRPSLVKWDSKTAEIGIISTGLCVRQVTSHFTRSRLAKCRGPRGRARQNQLDKLRCV